MTEYLARRLLLYVPTLLGVSLVIFMVMRVIPGDPALIILGGSGEGVSKVTDEDLERVRSHLGLDKPLAFQYVDWITAAARFDFGTSLRYNTSVTEEVLKRMPVTIELSVISVIIALLVGLPIGLLSGLRQNTWTDHQARLFSVVGLAVPNFWLATLLILALSQLFNWVPPLGYVNLTTDPWKHLQQIGFPALVLGYSYGAFVIRMSRAQVLEVLRQDYIRTAYSKGLRDRQVMAVHALRNAMLPVITLSGLHLGALLGGSVTIELIFSLPGLGRLLLEAISFRDYATIQALVLLIAAIFLTVNLLVDLLLAWIDPRIRYA